MQLVPASLARAVEGLEVRHARWLGLAPLLIASVAHAQAPGEVMVVPVQPVVPIAVTPVAVVPVDPAAPVVVEQPREPIMANRWSIGLSVGALSLAPQGQSDTTDFSLGELALRFRLTPHLELEASAGGGRQQINNKDADLEINTAALAARWRFNPEGSWNWFAMAGIGAASIASHEASSQQRDDVTQPLAMLGIGLEWRFRHLALQAETRAVALGERNRDSGVMADSAPPAMTAATTSTPVSTTSSPIKQSGASFTVGLSYYF